MGEKCEKIWFDGKLVNWDDAKVHVLAQIDEHAGHSRVLAYRYHFFLGYYKILLKLIENLSSEL